METRIAQIKIREIVDGYLVRKDDSVIGWGGNLNITPSYQREYIRSKDRKWQNPLIQSIYRGHPINLVYFAREENGSYNLLDGQQRLRTICDFIKGKDNAFAVDLEGESYIYDQIAVNPRMDSRFMDYELLVCLCEGGSDDDYMRWFKTINTGAEKLTEQEMRNALCDGSWVASAKTYFSSTTTGQTMLCNDLLGGNRKRQQHFERILRWHLGTDDGRQILTYMQRERNRANADNLWNYYLQIHTWVASLFDVASKKRSDVSRLRNSMGKPNWGRLYATYREQHFDFEYTRSRAREMLDYPELKKKGQIYEYILGGEENAQILEPRFFDDETRESVWLQQDKLCAYQIQPRHGFVCINPQKGEMPWGDTQADHIKPWVKGGRTVIENCQVLCSKCNQRKSSK